MAKWGLKNYFTLIYCYGETIIMKQCREYTQVHMVRWWNKVMKWWNIVTIKTFISLWLNVVTIKVKWCREYIQVYMVKLWNKLAEMSSLQNGKMVKRLYSPSSSLYFVPPSNNGYQSHVLTTSAFSSVSSASVVSRRFQFLVHSPTPFNTLPPPLLLINKFILSLPPVNANTR